MTGPQLVLFCGSRTWTDQEPIRAAIAALPFGSTVVTGGAPGADRIAERLARERRDLELRVMRADWARHGRRAGVLRNLAMLDQRPDRVLAFQRAGSPGTAHAIAEARRRGIPVVVQTRR